MNVIATGLVRLRIPLLLIAVVTVGLAAWPAAQLEFDRSIENMFSTDSPLLGPHRRLKERFGGNEIVLIVYDDPELLAASGVGLQRLAEVAKAAAEVPGVRSVLSLNEVSQALDSLDVTSRLPFGRPKSSAPAILSDRPLARAYRDLFSGYTHGVDGRTVAVACLLDPATTTTRQGVDPRQATIAQLRAIAQTRPQGTIAGEPVMVVDGFQYLEADGSRLSWWTSTLLAVTIFLLFRSLRWVIIPIAVVWWALLTTRGILWLTGFKLSMVSSMLTAIVTVVAVATVIHIIVRFRSFRSRGQPPRLAMISTLEQLVAPIFWACLTDAVGFAALMLAQVGPVHDFGVMMAIGSLMVLIGTLLIVPGLALIGSLDIDPHTVWGERALGRSLSGMVHLVERRPGWMGLGLCVLLLWALAGLPKLTVETDFTKNFREDSPVVESYTFVENRLGGAGVWDIVIPAPSRLTRKYVDQVLALEEELRALRFPRSNADDPVALTKVISLADAVTASDIDARLAFIPLEVRAQGMAAVMPDFTAALRWQATPGHALRVMLRSHEQQSAEAKLWLIDQVEKATVKYFPGPAAGDAADETVAEVTGFYVLLASLIDSVLRDQWICFIVATIGIGLMMMLAFRSIRLSLVALVPNALPIMLVLGGLGWNGVPINMGAAMIAAVSMGLSVDSSIHYVTAYQRARRSGKSKEDALEEVQQSVGRAASFSTLALIVGFSTLCVSEFIPTVYFGALCSLSMLGGLAGNLLVLPLLIWLIAPGGGKLAAVADPPANSPKSPSNKDVA